MSNNGNFLKIIRLTPIKECKASLATYRIWWHAWPLHTIKQFTFRFTLPEEIAGCPFRLPLMNSSRESLKIPSHGFPWSIPKTPWGLGSTLLIFNFCCHTLRKKKKWSQNGSTHWSRFMVRDSAQPWHYFGTQIRCTLGECGAVLAPLFFSVQCKSSLSFINMWRFGCWMVFWCVCVGGYETPMHFQVQ